MIPHSHIVSLGLSLIVMRWINYLQSLAVLPIPHQTLVIAELLAHCARNIFKGTLYGSFKSQAKNSSIVLAYLNGEIRPARINFLDSDTYIFILAHSSWFKHHPQCGKPVTVWEHDDFQLRNFVPVQYIKCHTVSLIDKLDDVYGTVFFPIMSFKYYNCGSHG